jgi:hypothetical protein
MGRLYSENIQDKIINGNFEIWQRGSSFTAGTTGYYADRFGIADNVGTNFNVDQIQDSPNKNSSYCMRVGINGTPAIGAGDQASVFYKIEGRDVKDILGKKCVAGFWVKTNKLGTYCLNFRSPDAARSYISEYTVTALNTWQFFEIPLKFVDTGNFNTSSSSGLELRWMFVGGATRTDAPNVWHDNSTVSVSPNQVNFFDNVNNYFQITQVQFHEGLEAIPYEKLAVPHADQLARCQRYYYRTSGRTIGSGYFFGTTSFLAHVDFPVMMRTDPICAAVGTISNFTVDRANTSTASFSVINTLISSNTGVRVNANTISPSQIGYGTNIGAIGDAYLEADAEI